MGFDTPILNLDHRQLVLRVKAVCQAMEQDAEPAVLEKALAELRDFTSGHFEREEALMCGHGYSGFAAHASEHETLIAQLDRLKAGVANETFKRNSDTVLFLREWVINHIFEADRAFAEFMKSRTQQG